MAWWALGLWWATPAGAAPGIAGRILDPEGQALEQAVITLQPGDAKVVTDPDGRFSVTYLRDEAGDRLPLRRQTDYTLVAWKPGYAEVRLKVAYTRGSVEVAAITLAREAPSVQDPAQPLDPTRAATPAIGEGATYEGH
jgi:hypothetical protein